MRQKLLPIAFFVGLLAGDITYRLTEFDTYKIVLFVAVAVTAVLYLLSTMHELIRDGAVPLVGGFAVSGAIKWVFATMLS